MATYIGNSLTERQGSPAGDPATNISMGQTSSDWVIGSRLLLTTAVGKVVPGATSLSFRNNADSADNLIITDAGNVTIRGTLTRTAGSSSTFTSAAGAQEIKGVSEELIVLSTTTTLTNSTTNMLPANSVIGGVTGFVNTTITGSTDWKLGDPTSAGRFTNAATTILTAGQSIVGLSHLNPAVATTLALSAVVVAATTVRVTATGVATAGKIRVTCFYTQYVPATS